MDSSISRIKVTPFPLAHEDKRRTIHEIITPVPSTVRITVIGPHDACSLGHHYHPDMEEVFILSAGSARLIGQYVDEENKPQGERTIEMISAPALIVVPKRVAHLFEFDGPGTLVCLASQEDFKIVQYKLTE